MRSTMCIQTLLQKVLVNSSLIDSAENDVQALPAKMHTQGENCAVVKTEQEVRH